jgi:hypothetical protein
MRCMVIVKANKDSEAGIMPSQELLTAMGKYIRGFGASDDAGDARVRSQDAQTVGKAEVRTSAAKAGCRGTRYGTTEVVPS